MADTPGVGPGEGNSGSCGITSRTFDSFNPDFLYTDKNRIFIMLTRGRAEEARQAHNLEAGGSNPPPATNTLIRSELSARTLSSRVTSTCYGEKSDRTAMVVQDCRKCTMKIISRPLDRISDRIESS